MERFVNIKIYMPDTSILTGEYLKKACEILHQLDGQDLKRDHILFNNDSEPLFKFANNLSEEQPLR